jgi:uncharacterized membrane protein YeaQ/YmgE (transglycosylase-associated protein family)
VGILSWIVVGFIAGWLSGLVMKGGGYGCIGNILVGIIGGLAGGYLAGALFDIKDPVTGINWQTVLTAFLGAVAVMAAVRILRRL